MKTVHIMVQGEGLVRVDITPDTTILQVAEANGWEEFGFTVDEVTIARDNWSTTTLWDANDVWAVKGAKGA